MLIVYTAASILCLSFSVVEGEKLHHLQHALTYLLTIALKYIRVVSGQVEDIFVPFCKSVLIVTEPLDRPCALQGCLRHSMGRLVWALTLTLLTLLWPGAKANNLFGRDELSKSKPPQCGSKLIGKSNPAWWEGYKSEKVEQDKDVDKADLQWLALNHCDNAFLMERTISCHVKLQSYLSQNATYILSLFTFVLGC